MQLNLTVADVSSIGEGNEVDLYGLGIRNIAGSLGEEDWFENPSGGVDDTNAVLLSDGFITSETGEERHITLNITAYMKTMYNQWKESANYPKVSYIAFRLNMNTDLGCTSSCNGGCSIRRTYVKHQTAHISGTLSPSLLSPTTSMVTDLHQSRFATAKCRPNGGIDLDYVADSNGNKMIDYSTVGYRSGDVPVPTNITTTPKTVLTPSGTFEECIQTLPDSSGYRKISSCVHDDSSAIQSALDLGGVVLLRAGDYFVSSSLRIDSSETIVRGEGTGPTGGTTIWATSDSADFMLFIVGGQSDARKTAVTGSEKDITDNNVHAGARVVQVVHGGGFEVGDIVEVVRISTNEWIGEIGMDQIPDCEEPDCYQWEAGDYELVWERTLVDVKVAQIGDGEDAITVNVLTLDHPLPHHIRANEGGGKVRRVTWSHGGRIKEVGIHNLTMKSTFNQPGGTENTEGEENHAKTMIHIDSVSDSWVSDVRCYHQWLSCIFTTKNSQKVTAQKSSSHSPISRIFGGRRYSFNIDGSLTLFKDLVSYHGRHDYVSGSKVTGPNAFVSCSAFDAYADIGPHHRYAQGQLYDRIMGGSMRAWDRGAMGSGHGWSGAYITFWNCVALETHESTLEFVVEDPGIARNYNIGGRGGTVDGEGQHDSNGIHVFPNSLYEAQRANRTGERLWECAVTTESPSQAPTQAPSASPSVQPSEIPTNNPSSSQPTLFPSKNPSALPSSSPTVFPSIASSILSLSAEPSAEPCAFPSNSPSIGPSSQPTTHVILRQEAFPKGVGAKGLADRVIREVEKGWEKCVAGEKGGWKGCWKEAIFAGAGLTGLLMCLLAAALSCKGKERGTNTEANLPLTNSSIDSFDSSDRRIDSLRREKFDSLYNFSGRGGEQNNLRESSLIEMVENPMAN
mgnify:CR=1 FL=1